MKNTMTRFIKHFAWSMALMAVVGQSVATPVAVIAVDKSVTTHGSAAIKPVILVNVAATPRQTFRGFGFSQIGYPGPAHDAYNLTPPGQREQIADLVYTDLKTSIVRMWMGPRQDSAVLAFYRDKVVPEAKAKGVTTFLLAPGVGEKAPADYAKYGRDLADFIKWAVDSGLQIDVTGLNNEPGLSAEVAWSWKFDGIVTAVKELRRQLDRHQLQRIGIIAPEGANADGWLLKSVQALKADDEAWGALRGIASHSYGYAMKEEHGQVALTGDKEYWMTESSENGQENAGDGMLPYVTASRFLNDLNHGATHWVWFMGYYREAVDANDGKTKLVNFDPNTGAVTSWPKFHYLKHVLGAFPYGTVLRHCTSPTAGEMNRNGSDVSQVNVAAGRRPDQKLAIAITSGVEQSVTVNLAELAGKTTRFKVLKSAVGNYQQALPDVTAVNGAVTIPVGPLELFTLVSED
jgi:hypothetical protein